MSEDRFLLSLTDIAGWPPFDPIATSLPPPMVAGIPSLQRGLVWDPRRVEMLWDSLFRGFPIGSFVACDKLDETRQSTRGLPGGAGVTHHLLDGQQRAQAIGLGYQDPFARERSETGRILWLDLAPSRFDATRKFLFRVTTRAHPWGYSARDGAGPVGVAKMNDSLKLCDAKRDANGVYVRPEPYDCWPIEAEAPVPLAWLLADPEMSEGLLSRLKALERPWVKNAMRAVENQCYEITEIRKGLHRLPDRRILCDVLSAQGASGNAVWDAELLFHRMNTGGKPLDGDELAWSLLKATWPELELIVAELKQERRIPEARLIRLAARLPLVEASNSSSHPRRLSSAVGIAELRRLSADRTGPLADFLLRGKLERIVRIVAGWMTSAGSSNLPPVLQAEIARGSPDAFVLALWLAQRAMREGTADDPGWIRPVQALLSSIRWFSRNASASVDEIVRRVSQRDPGPQALRGVLRDLERDSWPLMALPRPELVSAVFSEPRKDNPNLLAFSTTLEMLRRSPKLFKLDNDAQRLEAGIDSLRRLFRNREMMLYAQREWLCKAFPKYDPSDEDTWRDHGRPWDFDHLLPSAATYRREVHHKDVLTDWASSVGNLRAWPREDNRSDGARSPDEKLKTSKENQLRSFISEQEFAGIHKGFLATEEISSNDPNGHLSDFITACSSRIQRMHAAWWGAEGLSIVTLPPTCPRS